MMGDMRWQMIGPRWHRVVLCAALATVALGPAVLLGLYLWAWR
jgi:hypothetical protein